MTKEVYLYCIKKITEVFKLLFIPDDSNVLTNNNYRGVRTEVFFHSGASAVSVLPAGESSFFFSLLSFLSFHSAMLSCGSPLGYLDFVAAFWDTGKLAPYANALARFRSYLTDIRCVCYRRAREPRQPAPTCCRYQYPIRTVNGEM